MDAVNLPLWTTTFHFRKTDSQLSAVYWHLPCISSYPALAAIPDDHRAAIETTPVVRMLLLNRFLSRYYFVWQGQLLHSDDNRSERSESGGFDPLEVICHVEPRPPTHFLNVSLLLLPQPYLRAIVKLWQKNNAVRLVTYYHECEAALDEPVKIHPEDKLLIGTAYVNQVKSPIPREGEQRTVQVWIWKKVLGTLGWQRCNHIDDIRHPEHASLYLSLTKKNQPGWVGKSTAQRGYNSFTVVPSKKARARRHM